MCAYCYKAGSEIWTYMQTCIADFFSFPIQKRLKKQWWLNSESSQLDIKMGSGSMDPRNRFRLDFADGRVRVRRMWTIWLHMWAWQVSWRLFYDLGKNEGTGEQLLRSSMAIWKSYLSQKSFLSSSLLYMSIICLSKRSISRCVHCCGVIGAVVRWCVIPASSMSRYISNRTHMRCRRTKSLPKWRTSSAN